MIWEYKLTGIVMLTGIAEGGKVLTINIHLIYVHHICICIIYLVVVNTASIFIISLLICITLDLYFRVYHMLLSIH